MGAEKSAPTNNMDNFILSIINENIKPRPHIHCDLPEDVPDTKIFIALKGQRCGRPNCGGNYHHFCANQVLEEDCYVCECKGCAETTKGMYHFYAPVKYFKDVYGSKYCWWCKEHCLS